MRIKVAEHTKIVTTRISDESDKLVTKYCIDNNKSKSEFVREAVERYISYLELWELLIEIGEKDYE